MSQSQFDALHPAVQKWIYQQKWPALRPIQERTIQPIMAADRDLVVSAATAAGKTEAFFLPACSVLKTAIDQNQQRGFGILYISPLKALINDQYRRLESLATLCDFALTAWHGDAAQSKKNKIQLNPNGILLITPESLEAMLINKAGWVSQAFADLRYIVIDEFHVFIGQERGFHLISLLQRLEFILQKRIPRIALSATLSELDKVPGILRPNSDYPHDIISTESGGASVKLKIYGYINAATSDEDEGEDENEDPNQQQPIRGNDIFEDLYQRCRGGSYLIFANSRKNTEAFAVALADKCASANVPNEFFPHHGSLAKDIREMVEARLQKEQLPTTAVCTMTLELGIDIGKVDGICQVSPPHSVSSLRQRLGRSGRRAAPAQLSLYIEEDKLTVTADIGDQLRLSLLQSLAMIRLLISSRWYEPVNHREYHFSTLLQQILALLSQWGGVRAQQLFQQLCRSGPFNQVSQGQFGTLLKHMGDTELICQLGNGQLVLGAKGEKLASHYTFFAVFNTPEEYRIIANGRTLGTLPITSPLLEKQCIIFSGRKWQVSEIDTEKKVVYVTAASSGKPPIFDGTGMNINDRIRQEMLAIYRAGDYRIGQGEQKLDYIDATARTLFNEGLGYFRDLDLDQQIILDNQLAGQYQKCFVIPWLGDRKIHTLVALLIHHGFSASAYAGIIEIDKSNTAAITQCFTTLANNPPADPALAEQLAITLASAVDEKHLDKYDHYLPDSLLVAGYARRSYDIQGTFTWLKQHFTDDQ